VEKKLTNFILITPLHRFRIRAKHEIAVEQWIEHIESRRCKKQERNTRTNKTTDDQGYKYSKNIKGRISLLDITSQNRYVYKFPWSTPHGSIGRSSSNDIIISSDGHISRSHCRIEIIENIPYLLDLGTNSGTYLNGVKIKRTPLKPKDIIKIGKTKFEFQVKEGDTIFSKNSIEGENVKNIEQVEIN